jgi:hypothetical protein
VDIRFFYQNGQRAYKREVIIDSFIRLIKPHLDLPDIIEVCLYPLDPNVYGGIDVVHKNRIAISTLLELHDIPKILTHELIHVSQKHTGLLKINSNGLCYWRGIPYTKVLPEEMSYEDYMNLPWELDVQKREKDLLKLTLSSTYKKN